ncbi:MAG: CBS domain-containing protein [bacterium]|nr:CBS domain-containing protein [bacterium]
MECPSCGYENAPGTDVCDGCQVSLDFLSGPLPPEGLLEQLSTEKLATLIPESPFEVTPDTPLREAVERLVETGRHCALVVSGGAIVGILTERDILMKAASEYDRHADSPVSEFMTAGPETLTPDNTIAFGLNRMTVGAFRHLPIADQGHPLGVVAVRRILAYMVDRHPNELAVQ